MDTLRLLVLGRLGRTLCSNHASFTVRKLGASVTAGKVGQRFTSAAQQSLGSRTSTVGRILGRQAVPNGITSTKGPNKGRIVENDRDDLHSNQPKRGRSDAAAKPIESIIDSAPAYQAIANHAIADIDAAFLPPTIQWKDFPTTKSSTFYHPLENLILFEDNHIIVVFKPPSILSQSSTDKTEFNMFDYVVDYLTKKTRHHKLKNLGKLNAANKSSSSDNQSSSDTASTDSSVISQGKLKAYRMMYELSGATSIYSQLDGERREKEDWRHYLSVVNRLDRPCSGILLYAKNPQAASYTANAFAERIVDKQYMCVVNNNTYQQSLDNKQAHLQRKQQQKRILPLDADGNCHHFIQKTLDSKVTVVDANAIYEYNSGVELIRKPSIVKDKQDVMSQASKTYVVNLNDDKDDEKTHILRVNGKEMAMLPALLSYSLIVNVEKAPPVSRESNRPTNIRNHSSSRSSDNSQVQQIQSLLQVITETGRKHQIRAQLAHIGHPIVGDIKYGAVQRFRKKEVALHSYSLMIRHPETKKKLYFTVPPPLYWQHRFGTTIMNNAIRLVSEANSPQSWRLTNL